MKQSFPLMLSKKKEQATSISSCSRNHARVPDETGMEQVLSDLQALKGLYGLLHRGQAIENLDEASRALLMRMLDDATKQALLRQAKMLSSPLKSAALERKLSIQPDRRTRGSAEQRLKQVASPSLSLHASEKFRRLELQSSVRSRDDHRVDDHRRARDEHLLAHVDSNHSSRTAMTRRIPNPEQRIARLGSHRSSMAAEPRRTTVNGNAPRADGGDGLNWPRRGSGRGDQSPSLERSNRRRSVSREPSTRGRERLHGLAVARLVGAENGSSTRRFGRLDSGLSVDVMSRRGSERSRRGAATPRRSSSTNNGTVTIRSCIRPNRELCLGRAEEAEEESPPRRRRKDGAAGSVSMGWSGRPRRTLNRIDSGSTYSSRSASSGAAIPSPSPSPTVPSTTGASASCCSSSVSVSRRGSAQPEYAFEVSSASRSRRRRERQERRDGRLRRFKNKFALVFHHRHDHHHHDRDIGRGRSGGQAQEGPSRRDRSANHGKAPWRYLGGIFHRTTGHDGDKKTTTSRTVVTVPAKRCGGGHVHSLFDALVRHKWGARRAPAPARAGMRRTVSRVQVKKMHWWERLRSRRRLGAGKTV